MSKLTKTEREILIWKLLNGFPGSHSNITAGVVDAYVDATLDCSEEAIIRSVEQYRSGRVEEHQGTFAPSSADFARNVRMWVEALRVLHGAYDERTKLVPYPIGGTPPPPAMPLGPIKIDFGAGEIDMTNMSPAEKEVVMRGQERAPNAEGLAKVQANLKLMRDLNG